MEGRDGLEVGAEDDGDVDATKRIGNRIHRAYPERAAHGLRGGAAAASHDDARRGVGIGIPGGHHVDSLFTENARTEPREPRAPRAVQDFGGDRSFTAGERPGVSLGNSGAGAHDLLT